MHERVEDPHDVIVVGARVAGASTAMLLARAGHRVLVLDRARPGSDTLSSHALMRPAVLQLERWGVLDDVVAAGTPAIDGVVFHYADDQVRLDLSRRLYAPRRTVLDPLLVAAAEGAGAEVRFGVDVLGLLRDADGRVVGVTTRDRTGRVRDLHAGLVVGADGRSSRVAAAVDAPFTHASVSTSAFAYAYVDGVATTDAFDWCYRPGATAGLIPTNDGLTCVFVGVPTDRFAPELRRPDGFRRQLAATSRDVAARVDPGRIVGPIRGFPGLPGWLRRPWGAGWALVGDAGYFKDPTTAHGITDALRDAELLARAIDASLTGCAAEEEAFGDYEAVRDRLSLSFLRLTDRVASFDWTLAEVQRLHVEMSELMQAEADALASSRPRSNVA